MKTGLASSVESVQHAAKPPVSGRRPWRALGMVRRLDFNVPGYSFVSDPVASHEPILEGRVRMMQLQPGLSMHGTEVVDLHNMVSRVNMKAGLRIVVVLAGEIDVSIGGQRVNLCAGDASRETAAVLSMPNDEIFERRWQRGRWERKLALHVTPEWLQSHGWVNFSDQPGELTNHNAHATDSPRLSFPSTLCITPWQPSAHALGLAEQLLCQATDPSDELGRLRLASRALELLYEALASQCRQGEQGLPGDVVQGSLRPRDRERMLRLRQFIDSEIQQPFTAPTRVQDLGRKFGLSASALQRQFRSAFGTTVDEYRRAMRLHQARTGLEQGLTISEAAFQAGYTSAANFATAFRRQFGMSPKRLCSRG